MALSNDDLAKLQEMQTLTTQIEADIKSLGEFKKSLNEIIDRRDQLINLYESDWMELVDSDDLDDAQVQTIEKMVPEGSYSILNQDTIWDALNDLRTEYIDILKQLALMLD